MESKFSVYYDSNYLMIDSFEYEVLKNNPDPYEVY